MKIQDKILNYFDKASCLTIDDEIISFKWTTYEDRVAIYFESTEEFQGIPYEEGGEVEIPFTMFENAEIKSNELYLGETEDYRITFYKIMELD